VNPPITCFFRLYAPPPSPEGVGGGGGGGGGEGGGGGGGGGSGTWNEDSEQGFYKFNGSERVIHTQRRAMFPCDPDPQSSAPPDTIQ